MPDAWGGACGRGGTGTWVPTGTAFTAGVVPVTTGGTAGGAFTTGGTAAGAAEFEVGKRFPMRAARARFRIITAKTSRCLPSLKRSLRLSLPLEPFQGIITSGARRPSRAGAVQSVWVL